MKIYLSHSSSHDFKQDLYAPLSQTIGLEHEIILPHGHSEQNSKHVIPGCDVVLAEVSYPSTGQGIELGWAQDSGVPIICFHQSNAKISSAIRFVTKTIVVYDSINDMVEKLQTQIKTIK